MSNIRVRRGVLASSLALALFAPSAFAQTSSTTSGNSQTNQQNQQSTSSSGQSADQQKATKLQTVTVTGSMIPRTEIEGPAPVVTITGEQIKKEGFTTLWEFLDSLPQVGQQSEDPAAWGSTSVNARSVNLRNLGPGFSLLMIDGHRIVDYPQPLSAQSNFQNYNNIPTGMIDHIEILASGASSIYGSDAVAGVVNVILKKNYQGDELQVTGGGATRGGRAYGDINFFGGKSGENWHVLYNVEKSNRSALWGSDRPYQDSVSDAGYGAWGPADRMFGYQYDAAGAIGLSATNAAGQYITPPTGTCSKFGNNFALSNSHTVNTNGTQITSVTDNGSFCSQPALFKDWVLTPGSRSNNAYLSGEYDFSNGLQVYGSMALYDTVGISNTQLPVFASGEFYDQSTGQVINQAERQLTSQEMGTAGNTTDHEQNWNLQTGLRGSFDDSRFNWDLNLNAQKYIVHEDFTGLDQTAMNNFFLGKQQGTTTDSNGNTIPVYNMNWQQFWNPITPQQYSQFAVGGQNTSSSWLDQAQFRMNGDLFTLPWVADQPIGWAAVLEAAHNGFQLSPDPREANSTTFQDPFDEYNTGGGTRQRYSLGNEFRVPLLDTVTWTISGRLDKYHDASRADVARTWGTGIEWRPYSGLLVRGSYGTNFKAPDMQAIYQTGSVVPVGDYIDPLQCINAIKAGQNNSTWCSLVQRPTSQYYLNNTGGSTALLPQTGHSWTYGFVWQIPGVEGLSFSTDYWHMGVDNAIEYLSPAQVLLDNAGCLTGQQANGTSGLSPYTAHASNSAYCTLVNSWVVRNASGQLVSVKSGPLNEASLYVSGIDASLDYKKQTEYGDFTGTINYTDNLSYKQRVLASDPLLNTRYNYVASRISWIADWNKGDWNVSVSGVRDGSMRASNYGNCNVLPNGIQPSMLTVPNGAQSISTGICQVTLNGVATNIPDSVYWGRTPVWITWNTSVAWQINDMTKLKLTVSNIFNRVGAIPYYAGNFEFVTTGQTGSEYNGREIFLTFDYKLD
ncbi:TonB-dependent receptor domain-containing protein [Dyella caseinilytica]|uniref:TonB-dependent receptor n=1 Tax=Dyella caseinilytica TaxID=1849581 RepID=A0ABX7GYU9_9GAMM|nr:TonB-dependent receptor [Dyella caseinilytica]QRN55676.1 TonB-dependent receptor [Dyella caseinilytica]GGA03606.1 membrane protein [Dyella caseinilytica]